MSQRLDHAISRFRRLPADGAARTAHAYSGCLADVRGRRHHRIRGVLAPGKAARIADRPSRQMNFYVDASEGHNDYLVSLALTDQAASDPLSWPRVARGRVPVPALN